MQVTVDWIDATVAVTGHGLTGLTLDEQVESNAMGAADTYVVAIAGSSSCLNY